MKVVRGIAAAAVMVAVGWVGRAEAADPYEGLRKQIDGILTDKKLEGVKMSARVVDCADGKVVYELAADEGMAPASNAKLLIAAAATELLGPEFQYETVIWTDGKVANGVLAGNLVVRGSGDPNFSGRLYKGDVNTVPRGWAAQVAKAGIKEISGDLVCDDTLFDRKLVNPYWTDKDQQEWYAPQVSALAFNDNCVNLYVSPGEKEGDAAKLMTEPVTKYLNIINTCKTSASSKVNPAIWRTLGTNDIHVAGGVWVKSARGRHWIPIHQPALFLGTVFAEELEKAGVKVDGKVRLVEGAGEAVGTGDARTVVVFRSDLPKTVAVMDKDSQDMYAESMTKLLGVKCGKGGTWPAGIDVVEKFMTGKVGIPAGSFRLMDGSGLADQNRVTATVLTELLRYMKNSAKGAMFVNSLAVSGVDGTLEKRMAEAPYRGNILGKTGRIAAVRTMSGYVKAKSGKTYAFSMLASSVKDEGPVNQAQEEVCKLLYKQ